MSDRRFINARELARQVSRVLDAVEGNGEDVIVFRHGVPAALITPIGEIDPFSSAPKVEEEEEFEDVELTPDERYILELVASCGPERWEPGPKEWPSHALAIAKLEMKGLTRKIGASWAPTPRGRRAAMLPAEEGSP